MLRKYCQNPEAMNELSVVNFTTVKWWFILTCLVAEPPAIPLYEPTDTSVTFTIEKQDCSHSKAYIHGFVIYFSEKVPGKCCEVAVTTFILTFVDFKRQVGICSNCSCKKLRSKFYRPACSVSANSSSLNRSSIIFIMFSPVTRISRGWKCCSPKCCSIISGIYVAARNICLTVHSVQSDTIKMIITTF